MSSGEDLELLRLRWRCRRGLLELDLLLQNFLEQVYPQLDARRRRSFTELLSAQDDVLLAWLREPDSCAREDFRELLVMIR